MAKAITASKSSTNSKDVPVLRMGSVAFLAGIVIVIASTMIHPSGPDLMDNPTIFAVYAEDETWIAMHFGQLAGIMLIYA
jgi:stage V sporulation protein SpoVS